jgi:hypothetical protein
MIVTTMIILFLLLLVSCQDVFLPKSELEFGINTFNKLNGEPIYFEELKSKVLIPYCIECHGEYKKYKNVFGSAKEILKSVENRSMPKNREILDSAYIQLIEDWIKSGRRNKPAQVAPDTLDPINLEVKPTFLSISKHIFEPKCNRCHNEDDYYTLIDTTSLNALRNVKDLVMEDINDPYMSTFIKSIYGEERTMPPRKTKLDHLTKEEVDVIIEWFKLDLPE